MGVEDGANSDNTSLDWNRISVVAALAGAIGAGSLAINGTEDRFTGTQARAEKELMFAKFQAAEHDRDRIEAEIGGLRIALLAFRKDLTAFDATHPPEALIKKVDTLTDRIWRIEVRLAQGDHDHAKNGK